MRISIVILALVACFYPQAKAQPSGATHHTVECYAYGPDIIRGSLWGDLMANAYLRLEVSVDAESRTATFHSYSGHVAVIRTWLNYPVTYSDPNAVLNDTYSGIFSGSAISVESTHPTPAYPNSEYFRFRDFNANRTNDYDGGGMWGYFVISKKLATNARSFDAHYVLKAGDHLGGTIDFNCRPYVNQFL